MAFLFRENRRQTDRCTRGNMLCLLDRAVSGSYVRSDVFIGHWTIN